MKIINPEKEWIVMENFREGTFPESDRLIIFETMEKTIHEGDYDPDFECEDGRWKDISIWTDNKSGDLFSTLDIYKWKYKTK